MRRNTQRLRPGHREQPDPGYVRWYELPDGSAAVRCFSDSGGASCDWEHIKLKDKQSSTRTTTPARRPSNSSAASWKPAHRPEPANDPTICAICGAPLTDTTSSICPDCQELEKDW